MNKNKRSCPLTWILRVKINAIEINKDLHIMENKKRTCISFATQKEIYSQSFTLWPKSEQRPCVQEIWRYKHTFLQSDRNGFMYVFHTLLYSDNWKEQLYVHLCMCYGSMNVYSYGLVKTGISIYIPEYVQSQCRDVDSQPETVAFCGVIWAQPISQGLTFESRLRQCMHLTNIYDVCYSLFML